MRNIEENRQVQVRHSGNWRRQHPLPTPPSPPSLSLVANLNLLLLSKEKGEDYFLAGAASGRARAGFQF